MGGSEITREEPQEIVDQDWHQVNPVRGSKDRLAFFDAPDEVLKLVDQDEFRRAML
jgi:hypothetical protein